MVIGRGFVGQHVALGLHAAGRPVRTLSRRPAAATLAACGEALTGDAGDAATLAAALEGADRVVWCAGGLLPAAAEAAPALDDALTLQPLRTLIELLAGRPGVEVTYLSSGGTVYGETARGATPLDERAPTRPIGAYGRTRLAAERLLLDAHARGLVRVRVLRCANVYGPRQPADRGQGVVATFLARVAGGCEAIVFGDGSAVRDFLHVDDLVAAIVALLDRDDAPRLLNVGSGRGVSVAEVLRLVERATGRAAEVSRRPARPFDVDRIVLDTALLRAAVPFAPRSLETGLAETVAAVGGFSAQRSGGELVLAGPVA